MSSFVNFRTQGARGIRSIMRNPVQDRLNFAGKWWMSYETFIQHDSQGVQIGAMINRFAG